MGRFPHSRKWLKQLIVKLGKQPAESVISRAQTYYDGLLIGELSASKDHPSHRKELRHLIFPGLAVYRSLLEIDRDKSRVLLIMEDLFREDFFHGMGLGIDLLNRLPDPFPVIRPVLRMITRFQSPPGYQVIIKDTPDTFIIHAFRCLKLEVFTELNAGELTSLYCKTDDWLSEKLSKVHWRRTKTLAGVDKICDFCWTRKI